MSTIPPLSTATGRFRRSLPWLCLLLLCLAPAMGGGALFADDIDPVESLVEQVNPAADSLALRGSIFDSGPFVGHAASDVAQAVKSGTWFSFFVFLPFLILPQILLVIIIIKFRGNNPANKDRQPATFVHNTRLELVWTAIPVVALIIVAIPITRILDYQERPPAGLHQGDTFTMEVVGRQYSWIYNYPQEDLRVGTYPVRDLPEVHLEEGAPRPERISSVQEAAVFPLDRTASLFLTSQDVNHAWWVPAFGVKKDTFVDRHTHTWFTPNTVGYFKGTCAELCGENHGIMKISAVVLDEDDYRRWVSFKRHERDARRVVDAISQDDDGEAAEEAFATYIAAGDSSTRLSALRFWLLYDIAIHETLWNEAASRPFAGGIQGLDEFLERTQARRDTLHALLDRHLQDQADLDPQGTDA